MNEKVKEALQILFALIGLAVMIACFYMASEVKKHEQPPAKETQAIGVNHTVMFNKHGVRYDSGALLHCDVSGVYSDFKQLSL